MDTIENCEHTETGIQKTLKLNNGEIITSSSSQDIFNGVEDIPEQPKAEKKTQVNSVPEVKLVANREFMTASSQGHLDVVFKYLSRGGNPDIHDELNRTALHLACLEGHSTIVSLLLERGADLNFPDRLGSVAIHWACRGGSLRVVQALKSHGADLNVRDKLWSTPLHVATRTGHIIIVEYLLSCGVKINATDWEGDTALHDAVRLNKYKIVKILILAGADVNSQNNEGLTPVQQVKQWQFDILDTLHRLLKPQAFASTHQ
ncbi:hypothetical protein WMY93_007248 [Mugilogobius chulae]|uniref:Ankyrin repeat domain-containing protein 2 n=1 Tax=Mugilogobius chulae TaxID=88201 RepID=A0AAW0PTD2_9GOBI